MEDGTIRELQSMLEILKARLAILSEIHPSNFKSLNNFLKDTIGTT
jgi:hypothetical protein